jgi:hypothetical protein
MSTNIATQKSFQDSFDQKNLHANEEFFALMIQSLETV